MVPLRKIQTDVLVVGAGIAGLRAAMAARGRQASVLVVAKGPAASPGVLGFNAPVGAGDSPETYFNDCYRGGLELSDPALVRVLASEASGVVTELESLGAAFDGRRSGYHLLRPLGCSHPRLVHERNRTGSASMRLMRRAMLRDGVEIRSGIVVLELLGAHRAVNGALAVDTRNGRLLLIRAGAVVLATGGGGGIYEGSTYPAGLVGDGYALAFRAGAELIDLEFVQFEPCHCLFPARLGLSTTVFSHGGELWNAGGRRFVFSKYGGGEREAPKDALARLIAIEVQAGRGSEHGGVYCDLGSVPARRITQDHRAYYDLFRKHGIDLRRDVFEVGPAPHTFLGGVAAGDCGKTGVPGLYVAGEVMGGLHGANRLGGNAGTECYVFGARAGGAAAAWSQKHRKSPDLRRANAAKDLAAGLGNQGRGNVWKTAAEAVRKLMTAHVGVIREAGGLGAALEALKRIGRNAEKSDVRSLGDLVARAEIRNMVLVGTLVATAANRRKESRGVHYRSDFPQQDDARWRKSIGFAERQGRLVVTLHKRNSEACA